MPTGTISSSDFEDEIERQIEILDAMFGDPGLAALRAKTSHHPAVLRREALASFLPRRSRPTAELMLIIAELGVMMIDRQFWMPDPRPDYWSFIPDAAAAVRVQQNIHDPGTFNETIAEVRTWASLRQKGLPASLIEENGLPDIPIGRGTAEETWAEVKFIHRTTGERGVPRALEKANRQIRDASVGGAGVAYLWIDRLLAPRELPDTTEAAQALQLPTGEDPPPPDVLPRLRAVETALSSANYKSIAVAVVAWEDHAFIGDMANMTYLVRHQALVRKHATPRTVPHVDPTTLPITGWAAARIGRNAA